MLFYSKSKQKQLNSEIEIIDGLNLSKTIYVQSENRIYTLLLKGLIVFLISSGGIGCILTSTSTLYREAYVNSLIFVLSMILSLCYYNKKLENTGNILYLIMLIVTGGLYTIYINSGFYSWMNDLIGIASEYFDISEIGGYTERITDSTLTVTIAALYIGAVAVIIINMTIAKKMHHLDLILDALIVLSFPLYLEREPDLIYAFMLATGIIMTFIWRMSGQYLKLDNDSLFYQHKGKISYTYNIKSHSVIMLYISIIALIISLIFGVIVPKTTYSYLRHKSSMKNSTDEVVSLLATSGVWGLFNRYENTGGMSSGRLGGVNSVRLDYSTDLYVTYTPYDTDSLYIRSFIGCDYVPYSNYWVKARDEMVNDGEFVSLFEYGKNGGQNNSTGVMYIENIDAGRMPYMPYYSNDHEIIKIGETRRIQYCPLLNLNTPKLLDDYKLSDEEIEYWTQIPDENKDAIDKIINNIGLTGKMNVFEISNQIYEYYFNNYPYTLRPGATPRRKDFVNYFLLNNKKGYCAHFASAATLLFRACNIPARYVEGYAINSDTNFELLENEEYSDYYYGYKKISEEYVLKYDVTDANAHAWVEIYLDGYGWIPVELTPPSSDSDNNGFGNLMTLFNNSSLDIDDDIENVREYNFSKVKLLFLILLIILITVFIMFNIIIYIRKCIKYNRSTLNDKLIIRYHDLLKKESGKSDASFLNYNQTVSLLYSDKYDSETIEKIIKILNIAGFSDKEITEEEFNFVINKLSR